MHAPSSRSDQSERLPEILKNRESDSMITVTRESLTRRAGRRVADETGAALLIVLVALVGLTALAAGSLIVSESDIRVTENMDAGTRAFYMAEAAMSDYLGVNTTSVSPTSSYGYADGTATVKAEPLLAVDALLTLYRVTAVGSYSSSQGGVATRTMSRLVMFHAGGNNKVSAPGAITAIAGFDMSGGADSASISGFDSADPMSCSSAGTDIPGVTVPDSGYTWNSSDSSIVSGDPPVDESYPTSVELAGSVNIDWAEVLSGSTVPFDHVVNDIKNDFPDLSGLGPDDWPVTFVDLSNPSKNKLAAKESGQGLLIVNGDIELSGEFQWDGVILVGGQLIATGQPSVRGATMAGLDYITGGSPTESSIGNGQLEFLFNSCYAHNAFKNLGVYPPVVAEKPGTWSETM
jgi:hypothetical protein